MPPPEWGPLGTTTENNRDFGNRDLGDNHLRPLMVFSGAEFLWKTEISGRKVAVGYRNNGKLWGQPPFLTRLEKLASFATFG